MRIDRRQLLTSGAVAITAPGLVFQTSAQTPAPSLPQPQPAGLLQPSETLDLWSNAVPHSSRVSLTETVQERSTDSGVTDRAVWGISRPRLVVFRPDRPNGAAVLLIPGGGYRWVVIDKEGYELGRWLAARGFTAFVLFYRLPGEGWSTGPDTPVIDAQRAVRIIRYRAADFPVDPQRIATMGFSAGGHVCADLSARFDRRLHAPQDDIDDLSARPLCAAPIYPVVSMDSEIAHAGSRALLLGAAPTRAQEVDHSPDETISSDAPPHFLLHAADDASVPVENTLRLYAALRRAQVPVEMHLFAHGGHGFGLRKTIGKPVESWPQLWRAWAASIGLG